MECSDKKILERFVQADKEDDDKTFGSILGYPPTAIETYNTDKKFDPHEELSPEDLEKLEAEGIHCFLQDGSGINATTDLIVVSTAIEDTVYEVQKAKELNIPILRRSQVLALIAESKKTIAVGGTSGKIIPLTIASI